MEWEPCSEKGRKREDEPNEQEEAALPVGGDDVWESGITEHKGSTEF